MGSRSSSTSPSGAGAEQYHYENASPQAYRRSPCGPLAGISGTSASVAAGEARLTSCGHHRPGVAVIGSQVAPPVARGGPSQHLGAMSPRARVGARQRKSLGPRTPREKGESLACALLLTFARWRMAERDVEDAPPWRLTSRLRASATRLFNRLRRLQTAILDAAPSVQSAALSELYREDQPHVRTWAAVQLQRLWCPLPSTAWRRRHDRAGPRYQPSKRTRS